MKASDIFFRASIVAGGKLRIKDSMEVPVLETWLAEQRRLFPSPTTTVGMITRCEEHNG